MAEISPFFVNPDYATPEQIAQQRQYASHLLGTQQEVKGGRGGWAIGASNVVNALMGGMLARNAGELQQRGRQQDIASILGAVPTQGQPQPSMGGSPAGGPGPSADTSQPRGIRNNNPGNIEDSQFAKSQPGYMGTDGRFATFATPEHGQAAASNLLASYGNRGINTVAGVINRWAPPSDGNPTGEYAKSVAAKIGVDPNAQIDLNDPRIRHALSSAMFNFENGRNVPMAGGAPGAGSPPPMAFAGPTAPSPIPGDNAQPIPNAAPNPQAQPIPNASATPPQATPVQQGGLVNGPPGGQPANGPQALPINTRLLAAALGAQHLPPAVVGNIMQMAQPQLVDGPGGKYDIRTGQLVMPEFQKGKFKSGDTEFETSSQYDPKTGTWKTTPLLPNGGASSPARQGGPQSPATNSPFGGAQTYIDQATKNAAEKERQKTIAEAGGKAVMAPIEEVMKESKTAPQAINFLNLIEDTAKQYGDKLTTGPFGEAAMKTKQAVNSVGKLMGMGDDVMGSTAPSELITKMNANLASAATQAMTARGTQFDFKTFIQNSPGLSNSIEGTLWLTNILKQVHNQSLGLTNLAADQKNWGANWPKVQADYYAKNAIVNPATGKSLSLSDMPSSSSQNQSGAPAVGFVKDGYRFKGGNPNDQNSWEKAQ